MTCPRCGEPMSGVICDNCGFPVTKCIRKQGTIRRIVYKSGKCKCIRQLMGYDTLTN